MSSSVYNKRVFLFIGSSAVLLCSLMCRSKRDNSRDFSRGSELAVHNATLTKNQPDLEETMVESLKFYAMLHSGYCPDKQLPASGNAIDPGFTFGFGCHHPGVQCSCPKPSLFFDCQVNSMPYISKFGYCRIALWVWIVGSILIAIILGGIAYAIFGRKKQSTDEQPPQMQGGPPPMMGVPPMMGGPPMMEAPMMGGPAPMQAYDPALGQFAGALSSGQIAGALSSGQAYPQQGGQQVYTQQVYVETQQTSAPQATYYSGPGAQMHAPQGPPQ